MLPALFAAQAAQQQGGGNPSGPKSSGNQLGETSFTTGPVTVGGLNTPSRGISKREFIIGGSVIAGLSVLYIIKTKLDRKK